MKSDTTFKHWMHQFHDGGIRVTHFTSHMLHEKIFWAILVFVLLVTGLLVLSVLYGGQNVTLPQIYNNTPYLPLVY
ncbi:MAG: hypothetical protein ABFR47_06800 [Verrucomicrobiota bacterium]